MAMFEQSMPRNKELCQETEDLQFNDEEKTCLSSLRKWECEISHRLGRRTKHSRVWKPLPNRTLSRSMKGKTQRGQYLLVEGLGRYKWYQCQTLGDVPVRRLNPGGWT